MRKTSPGRYRHFKGGEYLVLFDAIDVTNGQRDRKVVVYANRSGKTFVRDLVEFKQQVVDPKTNKLVRRFSKIAVRKSR